METNAAPLKEFLVNMVIPEQRASVNIIPEHVTMLTGTKAKKKWSFKADPAKCKFLTRRDFHTLGLNALATEQMKYEEAYKLHDLWKAYMTETLGIKTGYVLPQLHEKKYDQFCQKLSKLDVVGAKLQVIESKCSTLINLKGIVVLETKNVFKIISKDNRIRTLPKKECNFAIKVGNMTFTLFGGSLCIRPSVRSTKKIKSFPTPLMV